MDAFYILKINKFDALSTNYVNAQQTALYGLYDDAPSISFSREYPLIINEREFIKYDLITEKSIKQRGRAYGTYDIFDKFISINESSFYYCHALSVLILHCSKEVFNQFYKAFKSHTYFEFSKITIDFDYIIRNQSSLGIEGIWLGEISDVNIKSLLMLGNNVEDSTKYRQLRAEGAEISNITIVYDYDSTQKKLMITKDGGIILYNKEDESNSLLLINHVYNNLMS